MDKTSTPHHSTLSTSRNLDNRRTKCPSKQAIEFLKQFARAYRVDNGIELILN